LANKAADRKHRKIASLVLGSEPTKAWGEDVIKQRSVCEADSLQLSNLTINSTLNQAYSQLISSFLESAQDHSNLAEAFNAQVTEALKVVEKNNDFSRRKASRIFLFD
jgi:formin-binding protein 1